MKYLIAAYAIALALVAGYGVHLALERRRLRRALAPEPPQRPPHVGPSGSPGSRNPG